MDAPGANEWESSMESGLGYRGAHEDSSSASSYSPEHAAGLHDEALGGRERYAVWQREPPERRPPASSTTRGALPVVCGTGRWESLLPFESDKPAGATSLPLVLAPVRREGGALVYEFSALAGSVYRVNAWQPHEMRGEGAYLAAHALSTGVSRVDEAVWELRSTVSGTVGFAVAGWAEREPASSGALQVELCGLQPIARRSDGETVSFAFAFLGHRGMQATVAAVFDEDLGLDALLTSAGVGQDPLRDARKGEWSLRCEEADPLVCSLVITGWHPTTGSGELSVGLQQDALVPAAGGVPLAALQPPAADATPTRGESVCPFCERPSDRLQWYHKKYGYSSKSPPYCYKCMDNFRKHIIKQSRATVCTRQAPCAHCRCLLEHIADYSESPQSVWDKMDGTAPAVPARQKRSRSSASEEFQAGEASKRHISSTVGVAYVALVACAVVAIVLPAPVAHVARAAMAPSATLSPAALPSWLVAAPAPAPAPAPRKPGTAAVLAQRGSGDSGPTVGAHRVVGHLVATSFGANDVPPTPPPSRCTAPHQEALMATLRILVQQRALSPQRAAIERASWVLDCRQQERRLTANCGARSAERTHSWTVEEATSSYNMTARWCCPDACRSCSPDNCGQRVAGQAAKTLEDACCASGVAAATPPKPCVAGSGAPCLLNMTVATLPEPEQDGGEGSSPDASPTCSLLMCWSPLAAIALSSLEVGLRCKNTWLARRRPPTSPKSSSSGRLEDGFAIEMPVITCS